MRFPAMRFLVPVLAVLAGCATTPSPDVPAAAVARFSTNAVRDELPQGWQPWIINRTKTPTEYRLVRDPQTGVVVLHAHADAAASGLRQLLDVDSAQEPVVAWRWRVLDLIISADNQDRYAEDSPVRLMLFFDGDKKTLPFKEQVLMDTAKLLDGAGPSVRDADVHLGEPSPGGHDPAELVYIAGQDARGGQRTGSAAWEVETVRTQLRR